MRRDGCGAVRSPHAGPVAVAVAVARSVDSRDRRPQSYAGSNTEAWPNRATDPPRYADTASDPRPNTDPDPNTDPNAHADPDARRDADTTELHSAAGFGRLRVVHEDRLRP